MRKRRLVLPSSGWLLLLLLGCTAIANPRSNRRNNDVYSIGVGIADITGPAAGVNMMGYANPSQTTSGIHTRLWSRAFIFSDGEKRVVFVSIDSTMGAQIVKQEVLKRLKIKYGELYTEANVCISGTHTHSAPGGFLGYVLYLITSLGFVHQTHQALVEGIARSIQRAHENIKPGRILYTEGELLDASINRSPMAYLKNPPSERSQFRYNVDKTMYLVKLVDMENNSIGMINWFSVHCTSMNESNQLISSDNKGVASLMFEHKMNPTRLPGKTKFVGAFAQSSEGDVSPNLSGARCLDTGLPCDLTSSTCNGRSQLCVAFGPGHDMFESTRIVAQRQFSKAWELFQSAKEPISGPIQYHQQYVDMTNIELEANGKKVRTCKPALGYSFAAGTTDGPGVFTFKQGTTKSNPEESSSFWNIVRNFIRKPSDNQDMCHSPKPILLSTGEMTYPYEWQPSIVDTQIMRIGNLIIAAAPGEFTTMSGRRLQKTIKDMMAKEGEHDVHVVIAGLSNTYTGYIVTPEEYQLQRYEGASTIYGPYTLNAYLQQYKALTTKMLKGKVRSEGPKPPNLIDKQISLLPGIIMDMSPIGKVFGSVVSDVKNSYSPGSTVSATFVCGHPRNNLQLETSYMTVEKYSKAKQKWVIIATDANWETKFIWSRTSTLLGQSNCELIWQIPKLTTTGIYRMRHFGHSRSLIGDITPYSGATSRFQITNATTSRIRNALQQRIQG